MKSRNISTSNQRGGALIILVLVLVLAGTAILFSMLNGNNVKLERNKQTSVILSEAKRALVGYALRNAIKPGTLPCTDTNNNGTVDGGGANTCFAYIGRLPWKSLGMPILKDANGECLWYALSPVFREQMTTATRSANPLNSSTSGTINLVDDAEVPIASVNPVIAVVIAPNNPVSGQNRSGAATLYCPGDSVAANYLDIKGAVNNATGNVAGVNYTFKKGMADNGFNDQLVYITAKDLFPLLRKRITTEIVGNLSPLAVSSGLVKYYQTFANTYPCPAKTVTGNADCTLPLGNNIPYNDAINPLQYTALGTGGGSNWLIDNGWFAMTTYTYLTPTHVQVTVTDVLGGYTCDANNNLVTCS